jgi:G3E family GTPase
MYNKITPEVNSSRIPVTILTGFLGSGKTTLLNNLIEKHKHSNRFAIIENEYGEMGIDPQLINVSDSPVYELSNGCICCTLNDDFYSSLLGIIEHSEGINHILVETTGVADPMTIIDLFLSNDLIMSNFQIDSVICIADSENLEEMLDIEPVVRKQIALSDIVLLNKIDVVNSEHTMRLKNLIIGINPLANIHETRYAYTNGTPILNTFAYSFRQIEKSTLSYHAHDINPMPETYVLKGRDKPMHHDIFSEGFIFEESFNPELFNIWMSSFLYFNQKTIYRAKGILNFSDRERKGIVQAVNGSYLVEEGRRWQENENRFSKIVFIGKNLVRRDLEKNLMKLLMKGLPV